MSTTHTLLDPKNDYVFKRLFGEAPELLMALINDLRPDLPEITSVEILNPNIDPAELNGKYIILDVLARDADGCVYNIEIQVRRYGAWQKRGLYYLARMLSLQLNAGEQYDVLRSVIGIHLLDFDLFTDTAEQNAQAVWRFEMRDGQQPTVTLGNVFQLNLIELRKADRLGMGAGPLSDWVTFFEHWQEEQRMATISHAPIQQALNRVRQLSADEEAQRLAFVRERAMRDEVSYLSEARQEGLKEGQHNALATTLLQLLTLKFGTPPEVVQARVQQANAETLHGWIAQVLTAENVDQVFKAVDGR